MPATGLFYWSDHWINTKMMNPDWKGVENLLKGPEASNYAPVWRPDGRMIPLASNCDGPAQDSLMNADGGGPGRASRADMADLIPSCSPDSDWMAFTCRRERHVYHALDGDNVTRLTTTGTEHPTWSRK